MTANGLQDIEKLEASLWAAADNLRANSRLTSSEYCMPVLGIIFLRHATNRYNAACCQIEADQAAGKMPNRPPVKADFLSRRALMLPEKARYDGLVKLRKGDGLGGALVKAMDAIESDFPPLHNQLPKDYDKFDDDLLEDLLRLFDSEVLRNASGDLFGRIYEYFLMEFSKQGAADNGEFFTPPSLVQTIVNVIEPDHGIVFDPACGSGGMFVQSSYFIQRQGADAAHRVTFFGQEKTGTTIRLANMNLATHGLEGDIREANTFYEDVHQLKDGKPLWGNCDFVMANPPFNVDMVDAEKVKNDRRLPFGLPGINKAKKVSNGNYLWISYFWSYLSSKGRAGFVMSSQASSAGHGEALVRRKLVETGDVDVIIAIRSNFFYTRTVPCELWHFDRGKPAERRDQTLMIDARNIYRKVTRKIYDFSPEQLQNLTAIVWLYRGQSDRFLELTRSYLDRAKAEAGAIAEPASAFCQAYEAVASAVTPCLGMLPEDSQLRQMQDERGAAASACFKTLEAVTARAAECQAAPCPSDLEGQTQLLAEMGTLAAACRDLVKDIDLAYKLADRLTETARNGEAGQARAAVRLLRQLDARRQDLAKQLKQTVYFERQAQWLLSRFPEAKFVPVPGLCRVVTQADIEAADWSLTPGRYVGVSPPEVSGEFDFEQALREIHDELAELEQESATLAMKIHDNFARLGI